LADIVAEADIPRQAEQTRKIEGLADFLDCRWPLKWRLGLQAAVTRSLGKSVIFEAFKNQYE